MIHEYKELNLSLSKTYNINNRNNTFYYESGSSRTIYRDFILYLFITYVPLLSIILIFRYLFGIIKRKKAIFNYHAKHNSLLALENNLNSTF